MSFDLNNYQIISKIGFGAFGEVFKVEDITTRMFYAAKISSKAIDVSDESDDDVKNFKREVSIIAKIHHPSILKFIGMSNTNFQDEDKPVIVTDFLPNGSLEDILSSAHMGRSPSQWNDTLKLINIYGIASAMAFLHAHDIIHRDLKPANILLDELLFPVIADFGLSKDQDAVQSTIGIKGTPLYIAPEIWEDTNYSKEADVYAYGFILYEIYANEKPFSDLSMYKIMRKISSGERPDTSMIPNPFKNLIEKCWNQDPEERPTFEEIVEKLEEDHDFITPEVEECDFLQYVDYIKNSPKSVDKKVKSTHFDLDKSMVIKKVNLKKKRIYPDDQYNKLPKKAKKLVDSAIDDPNKQYEVGKNLVDGSNDFPQDANLGVKYLKEAIKSGIIEAVILYNRLLIIGKRIEGDNKQAKENLKDYEYLKNPEIIFLQSMAERKDENYRKSVKLLKRAIKGNCAEAMFEYGKMLYQGEGVDEDQDEALKYFEMAKKNGCNKSEKFLKNYQKKSKNKVKNMVKKKYDKYVDLVIMIDGTRSNKNFLEAIKACFSQIANEAVEDHPNVCFRFGVVCYRDFYFSIRAGHSKKLTPFFFDLTSNVKKVQKFFNIQTTGFGSIKYANDWDSGYFTLLNRMNWNEKAEKIVIHMCQTPAHGKKITMRASLHDKYFLIPRFKKTFSYQQNKNIYNKMQFTCRRRLFERIEELAQKGIKFYCLNGNEVSLYCFKNVANAFIKKGGKKFIVKDLFGYTFDQKHHNDDSDDDDDDDDIDDDDDYGSVDMEALKEQIDNFFSNVVKTCIENNEDDDENDFERKCKMQFTTDLNKFFRQNNGAPYRSTETTETDDDGLGDDDDDIDINDDEADADLLDADDDVADDDDDEDGYVKRKVLIDKKSSPKIKTYDVDDDPKKKPASKSSPEKRSLQKIKSPPILNKNSDDEDPPEKKPRKPVSNSPKPSKVQVKTKSEVTHNNGNKKGKRV